MKKVITILTIFFLVFSLFPFFDYFLYQYRNPDSTVNLTVSTTIQVNTTENFVIYSVPSSITSFQDFIISSYSYGTTYSDRFVASGLSSNIVLSVARVVFSSGNRAATSTFFVDVLAFSFLLSRTIYLACAFFIVFITVLPVVLLNSFFHRRLSR